MPLCRINYGNGDNDEVVPLSASNRTKNCLPKKLDTSKKNVFTRTNVEKTLAKVDAKIAEMKKALDEVRMDYIDEQNLRIILFAHYSKSSNV